MIKDKILTQKQNYYFLLQINFFTILPSKEIQKGSKYQTPNCQNIFLITISVSGIQVTDFSPIPRDMNIGLFQLKSPVFRSQGHLDSLPFENQTESVTPKLD